MYLNIPYKIQYDKNKFDFKKTLLDIFGVNSLEKLHLLEHYDLLSRKKDQSTIWHKMYYDSFESKLMPIYIDFVRHIKNCFGYEELIYQKIPTFRVHLANGNVAVGEWHKDKMYNHGVYEVNFWMPFVDTNSFNTIWIESSEDRGDYTPHEVKHGEILVFNGASLSHGNQKNTSCDTRVSFDFRLVDPKRFKPNGSESINTKTKFDIGAYFEKMI